MTINEYLQHITQTLQPLYDSREAAAVAKEYLRTRLNVPPYQLSLMGNDFLTEEQLSLFQNDLTKLASACPLQYVLGETEFYGLDFKVNPDVLIPRPETEELVAKTIQFTEHLENPLIWDVGTGSGCIAISLAKNLHNAKIVASDISQKALTVAKENARLNAANVEFVLHDMLDVESLPFKEKNFTVIASNPPYIPHRFRREMHANVREHEPSLALFVPDTDPLMYYKGILGIGNKCLTEGGLVMMETFDDYHDDLKALCENHGFSDCTSFLDINGKPRMFMATKKR